MLGRAQYTPASAGGQSTASEREGAAGQRTGLDYIASPLVVLAGPRINGTIVQWGGGNYNLIFVVTPAFFLLAILCMLGVTRGEARGDDSTG